MEKEGQTNIMNLATDGLEITKLSTAGSKEDPNKIMISTKLTPEERSELRLHFEWTKVNEKCKKMVILASF